MPSTPANPPSLDDPRLYINRELSLLDFNARVLEEAVDPRNRLLERVKFLSIVASNLDEFFMVRMAGLKQQIAAGIVDLSADGLTPAEQAAAGRKAALRLLRDLRTAWDDLRRLLNDAGVHVLDYAELNDTQRERVREYFDELVFPVLTPLAVDPGRPFPHISNLSLNLAVLVRDQHGQERFARLKVPDTLPRLVPLKRSSGGVRKDGTTPHHHYFIWLEQVIDAHLSQLFPGLTVLQSHAFHITRDADVLIQDLEAADLLETIEESVRQRRFGQVVRLTVNDDMPSGLLNILVENLEIHPNDVYALNGPVGPLGLASLRHLPNAVDRYDLKDPPFAPAGLNAKGVDGNIFAAIRRSNILLHHPYDSFSPVIDFLRAAAQDPDVLAIKQTLYRVGRNSPVVESLLDASLNGKQVAVLVELKARFDEESNIGWARALEAEGVHVVYGLPGLKTHAKIALVVRKEGEHIRRYLHLATGNYNAVTATLYTDLSLFTCDDALGADATDLFNHLTGYSAKSEYRKLLVAPINLREHMLALIDREIEHQRAGQAGRLIFKMNALVDKGIIRRLYQASQAGVRIDLLVRGVCGLRPGVPGVSENIRVVSIVGRFLEHTRIYYFQNAGQEEIYAGSADLMPRNLDRRVETLFPIEDPRLVRYLCDDVLAVYLADNQRARELQSDGSYHRLRPADGQAALDSQAALLRRASH